MLYLLLSFYYFCTYPTQELPNSFPLSVTTPPPCATPDLLEQQLQNPIKKQAYLQFEKQLLQANNSSNSNWVAADYTLPVVFHIIHENGTENIPNNQILLALEDLNDAFANQNYYDQGLGLDTKIEFCLAAQTPNNEATNGINRVVSPLTNVNAENTDNDLKNLIRWNPNHYINIWVVKEICSNSLGCDVAGYAFLPNTHGEPTDGIVVESEFMGSSPANSTVLIHEMGHYLGLYHTFRGGCTNDDCLMDGDRVCDTPPDQSTQVNNCDSSENSCATDTDSGLTTDEDDHTWNFMDYGNSDCQYAFTAGQAARMLFSIENPRASLLESIACLPPCLVNTSVDIQVDNSTVEVGESVDFSVNSAGATTFQWLQNGIATSTQNNWTTTFDEADTYQIIVNADNSNASCQASDTLLLEVVCAAQAAFTADQLNVTLEDMVYFSNTSVNATNFAWYMDDVLVSTEENFSFQFHLEGFYEVVLEVSNGTCSTRSVSKFIIVHNPCVSAAVGQIGVSGIYQIINGIRTNDGGYAILAVDYNLDDLVIKLNGHKQVEWSKHIDISHYYWKDIVQDLSDNALIVMGYCNRTFANEEYPFVFKMDLDGNLIWGFHMDTDVYFSRDLVRLKDGNFLLTGITGGAIEMSTFAIKFDSDGNRIWGKDFNRFRLSHSHEGPDGNIYLIATMEIGLPNDPDVLVMKLSSEGDIDYRKYYHTNQTDSSEIGFAPRPIGFNENGGLFITLREPPNGSTPNTLIISTDENGDILWTKKYVNMTGAGGVVKRHNGNYALFSEKDIIEINNDGDFLNHFQLQSFELNTLLMEVLEDGSMVSGGIAVVDKDFYAGECGLDTLGSIEVEPYPYQADSYTAGISNLFPVTTFMQNVVDIPFATSRICDVEIPQFSDAVPHLKEAFLCVDSLRFVFEICNQGSIEMAANAPIAIYDDNPTLTNPNLIMTTETDYICLPDSCLNFEEMIPYDNQTKLFVVANDNASVSPIYDFGVDFPITDVVECNFYNNLDSVNLDVILPQILAVTNDTTICEGTAIKLIANDGFLTYEWSRGDTTSFIWEYQTGAYQVSVTDDCGNTQVDTIQVDFFPQPILNLNNPPITCSDKILVLEAGENFDSYQWQDGSTESTYTVWQSGKYWVTVQDICGNLSSDTIDINLAPPLELQMPNDTIIYEGDEAHLIPLAISTAQSIDYQWFPDESLDCATCPEVTAMPDSTTVYQLLISDSNGCTALDSVVVYVHPKEDSIVVVLDYFTFAPNVFSPNGDGMNDHFYLQSTQPATLVSFQVFNRWGTQVFDGKNTVTNYAVQGWDGKLNGQQAADGVYVFQAEVLFKNGTTQVMEGAIVLIQ